jgi:hypothetical protein
MFSIFMNYYILINLPEVEEYFKKLLIEHVTWESAHVGLLQLTRDDGLRLL